jgi:ferritin
MPSERFVDALNAQVAREFAAAHQYTAIAAYYAAETFPQLAAFFYRQAAEERTHALKMIDYMIDTDAAVELSSVAAPQADFDDHIGPIRFALEQEQQVTGHITDLFELARETRDYRSEQFLTWFLAEQTEEESSMADLVTIAERTASMPMLLEDWLARETPGASGVTGDAPIAE